MDSKLLQDFLAQAENQLSTIRGGILVCAREGNRHGELQTSLQHTILIKEAAASVSENEVSWKAEELEKQIEAFVAIKNALPDEHSRQLLDKLTELEILIAQIHFNDDNFSESIADFIDDSFDNLLFGKQTPEPEIIQETEDSWDEEFEIDEEMLEIFASEAEELVQSITTNLKILEETPNEREALLEIRRNAHTLKGSAGIVGLKELSGVAHRVEDLLDYLAENEIEADRKIFKILSDSTDCFTALANGETSPQLTKTIARLYKQFDKLISALKKSAEQIPAAAFSATVLETPLPVYFENEVADAALPINQTRSIVRVSLDKLNDLMKITSGLVTSRSIFEQRLAELEQQIGELHNSTRRLQRSTGKLETDFEADMLNSQTSRFQTSGLPLSRSINHKFESKASYSFDSLELDRYSDFHQTMRELTETTGDTAAINTELDNLRGSLELLFENQRRLIEEMQEKLLRLRLVSFESLKVRLQRTVRVACDEEGKSAQLIIEGATLEVDTQILDSLIEPLLHLLRNAVAHGIELPETRRLLGKSEVGQILLQVKSEETHIILKISDDGRGIFADGLKEKAVRNGLITAAQAEQISRDEAFSLIFLPGLTTADKISQIAGRGVGMNIVKQNIAKQKGTISIDSEMQKGTTFTVRLPITLAVTRALLVKSDEQTFAFPLKLVKQASEISVVEYEQAKNKNAISISDVNYPVFYLSELLGLPNQKPANEKVSLLLLENLETPCALIVDEICKAEEIVIKQLGSPLQNLAQLLGATILGDGSIVPVLDLIYLLKQAVQNPSPKTQNREKSFIKDKSVAEISPSKIKDKSLSILIVDDSPSVRHLTANIIKNAGWTVVAAKDGLEALEILQEARDLPDAILSDVEMPRMDGYEFLSSLRRQENLKTIPVVMITSRANEKHRQKALDLGASDYLTKPFDDAKLIEIIKKFTAETF